MDPTVGAALAAAAAAIVGAAFTYRSAKSANRIDARKVDLEAFERSQVIYEKTIDRLQAQADRLSAQVEAVNNRLAQEQDTTNVLRDQIRTLRVQVDDLNSTVHTLRTQLVPRPSNP